jgi:intracellular multiplication protein IcmC
MSTLSKNISKEVVFSIFLIMLPVMAAQAITININDMFDTIRTQLPYVIRLIVAIAYVLGLWLIVAGFYSLKIFGDLRTMMPSNAQMGPVLLRISIGFFLLILPGSVWLTIWSLWGSGYSVIDYPDVGDASYKPVIDGVSAIIRVFGYIAFVRGLILLAKATRGNAQPGSNGKGMIHIVGGILAINIVGTIDIIKHSFGFT